MVAGLKAAALVGPMVAGLKVAALVGLMAAGLKAAALVGLMGMGLEAVALEVAAGPLLLTFELLRGSNSVCPDSELALLKQSSLREFDSAAQELAMSYASFLLLPSQLSPPSRLSFFLALAM